jgi:CheY-like chemotaxis protein
MDILVVEDEMLIAMLVEEMLQDLGCRVVGPVSTLEDALARISRDHLDGALLEANLRGDSSSPAADELLGLHVPFLLVTGYLAARRRSAGAEGCATAQETIRFRSTRRPDGGGLRPRAGGRASGGRALKPDRRVPNGSVPWPPVQQDRAFRG